jgi:lipopolysaccharide transport system ATP-binding protein
MIDYAIRTENLCKEYAPSRGRRADLRETLMSGMTSRRRSIAATPVRWALRNVCLDIKAGEIVGVIGHNGAGKSTLLRLLAGITPPTEGTAEINGRVAAMLDPGAGFHAELTGLENIYVYASLMGMGRAEIGRNLAGIIEFAGLRSYMDTPLKHYSSGMQVRLAFSVFVHLDAEVLIVDDVLDQADAAFQEAFCSRLLTGGGSRQCCLFVTHDLMFVRERCGRGVVLENGRIVYDGTSADAVDCCTVRTSASRLVDASARDLSATWR